MRNVMKSAFGGRRLKGFTLVELLIVVAIIGILTMVVVVSYSGAQTKAKHNATVTAINNAANDVNICVAGGSTGVAPTSGGNVCNDLTVTNAKWPAGDLNGYTINYSGVTVSGGAIAGFSTGVSSPSDTISCTTAAICTAQ